VSDDNFPDVEGAVRDWLKAKTAIATIVATRVFFGIPKGAVETSYPLVTVARVGGGDSGSDAPDDNALVQIDCWGSLSANGFGDKAGCRTLANKVRAACKAVTGSQTLVAGVDAGGMTVVSDIWLPDPANDRPRYALTVEVAAISTN